MRTVWMLLALFPFFSLAAEALDRVPVQFAGVAFISEHQDVNDAFPLSKKVYDQLVNTDASLDHTLLSNVSAIDNPSFVLTSDHLANLNGTDSAIVLAFSLDRETTATEKIGDSYKLLVDISVEALFFDFKQTSIIASYPMVLESISVYKEPPTDAQKLEVVRAILSGTDSNSLPSYAVHTLKNITVNSKIGSRLGIRHVSIDSAAQTILPPELRDNSHRAEVMLAQQFSNFLVKNQHVSVVPYTTGEAIGYRMSMRFANGRVFNLKLPEADFTFDLTLQGFKKVQFGQSAAGTSWVYGAFVTVTLSEPLSGKEYLNSTFKNGETKSVPATQANVEDWPGYQESLLGLFNKLTLAFSDPASDWLAHATSEKTISQQLRSTKKVIEQCSK